MFDYLKIFCIFVFVLHTQTMQIILLEVAILFSYITVCMFGMQAVFTYMGVQNGYFLSFIPKDKTKNIEDESNYKIWNQCDDCGLVNIGWVHNVSTYLNNSVYQYGRLIFFLLTNRYQDKFVNVLILINTQYKSPMHLN